MAIHQFNKFGDFINSFASKKFLIRKKRLKAIDLEVALKTGVSINDFFYKESHDIVVKRRNLRFIYSVPCDTWIYFSKIDYPFNKLWPEIEYNPNIILGYNWDCFMKLGAKKKVSAHELAEFKKYNIDKFKKYENKIY